MSFETGTVEPVRPLDTPQLSFLLCRVQLVPVEREEACARGSRRGSHAFDIEAVLTEVLVEDSLVGALQAVDDCGEFASGTPGADGPLKAAERQKGVVPGVDGLEFALVLGDGAHHAQQRGRHRTQPIAMLAHELGDRGLSRIEHAEAESSGESLAIGAGDLSPRDLEAIGYFYRWLVRRGLRLVTALIHEIGGHPSLERLGAHPQPTVLLLFDGQSRTLPERADEFSRWCGPDVEIGRSRLALAGLALNISCGNEPAVSVRFDLQPLPTIIEDVYRRALRQGGEHFAVRFLAQIQTRCGYGSTFCHCCDLLPETIVDARSIPANRRISSKLHFFRIPAVFLFCMPPSALMVRHGCGYLPPCRGLRDEEGAAF